MQSFSQNGSPSGAIPPAASVCLARLCGGGPATETVRLLGRYVSLTLEANQRLNLTAVRDAESFWVRHIEDSLLAAEAITALAPQASADGRLLDVGSGAGAPGVILAAVWPECRITLLEATAKKAAFLQETVQALGLANITVVNDRAENYGCEPDAREQFDLVTARAVAPMAVLAELTLPFVSVGGALAAIKSDAVEEEWTAARSSVEILGGRAPEAAPGPQYRRSDGCVCRVVHIPKIASTPEKYPRRPGVPVRRPLG